MDENSIDNELFNPEEMRSPFDSIKEVDAEGHEWWNSRKLALKVAPKVTPKMSLKVSSMFGLKSKYVRIRILPQKNWQQNAGTGSCTELGCGTSHAAEPNAYK